MTAPAGRAAVVAYLARQAARWHVLHAYHHEGIDAAVEALGQRGGAGHNGNDDGVGRAWQSEAGGRRLSYQEASTSAPAVRVPLREVVAWAADRITADQWRRIDDLVSARRAASRDANPVDSWRSPAQRSPAENARIAARWTALHAAERQLRDIIDTALTGLTRAGEQLDLFADLTTGSGTTEVDRRRAESRHRQRGRDFSSVDDGPATAGQGDLAGLTEEGDRAVGRPDGDAVPLREAGHRRQLVARGERAAPDRGPEVRRDRLVGAARAVIRAGR